MSHASVRRASDDDHVQGAGSVDPFDTFEFDVAGGGRAGDHGERGGRVQQRDGLGDGFDDLVGGQDDDVPVGPE